VGELMIDTYIGPFRERSVTVPERRPAATTTPPTRMVHVGGVKSDRVVDPGSAPHTSTE
jgi:hypothetical protein